MFITGIMRSVAQQKDLFRRRLEQVRVIYDSSIRIISTERVIDILLTRRAVAWPMRLHQ